MSEDVIAELKAHARVLHRALRAREPRALERLRALEKPRDPSTLDLDALTRSECLRAVARELGFRSWNHATAVLEGSESDDFGTLLHQRECHGHWNIWSASYEEASAIRKQHGGYLLPYKHQFLVVDRYYIESLGLDPDDPDWASIGRDWVKPQSTAARARLCAQLVRRWLTSRRM